MTKKSKSGFVLCFSNNLFWQFIINNKSTTSEYSIFDSLFCRKFYKRFSLWVLKPVVLNKKINSKREVVFLPSPRKLGKIQRDARRKCCGFCWSDSEATCDAPCRGSEPGLLSSPKHFLKHSFARKLTCAGTQLKSQES